MITISMNEYNSVHIAGADTVVMDNVLIDDFYKGIIEAVENYGNYAMEHKEAESDFDNLVQKLCDIRDYCTERVK